MKARALGLLALLLLVPGLPLTEAQASTPPVPPRNSVWTVFTTVEAVVQDHYATVKVIADIGNRGPDPEFPFQVRVPDDAFVTGLTLTRDGVTHEARIEDRQEARQTYDAHKAQELTGGLVEKTRNTSVYAFLVNVAEFESVRAVLTYERYLAADQGLHRLDLEAPVSGFGQDLGAAFRVVVRHADGVRQAWGSAGSAEPVGRDWRLDHRVGPRPDDAATPFQATYELAAADEDGSLLALTKDGVGYFAHRFRAAPGARELPLDLVLVLDTSGSMGGLKLTQLKDAAAQVIASLRDEDRLGLVTFSSGALSAWQGLRPATAALRSDAAADVQAFIAAGGTNLEAGLRDGFDAFEGLDRSAEEGRLPLLLLLTDGQPSTGLQTRQDLRDLARRANDLGAHVFTLAFGRDADWGLVAALAADGNGTALRVPEGAGAEVDLRRFMTALTAPVLRDVRLRYDGNVTPLVRGAPVLFAGSELLVVGTFDPALQVLRGEAQARAADEAKRYPFAENVRTADAAAFLPRLVAYHQIRDLQATMAAEGVRAEWVQRLKDLALRHGFVTDHTSLVVTLEAARRTCDDCVVALRAVANQTATAGSTSPPSAASGSGILNSRVAPALTTTAPPAAPPPPTPPPVQGLGSTEGADGQVQPQAPKPPVDVAGDAAQDEGPPSAQLERREPAETPGFEGLLALAALGVALVALRRRH